jgi:site-specific recombinase XerD
MTLTEAMAMLARQMLAEQASPMTVAGYESDVKAFVGYLRNAGAKDVIAHFTRDRVQAWLIDQTEHGLHPNTRNRRLAALHRLAQFLLSIEKLSVDPISGIRRAKKPKRVVRYLQAEIATRLIRAAGPTVVSRFGSDNRNRAEFVYQHRNEAILRCLVQGGLRIGEVEGLTLMRLRTDGFVVLGKGDKERYVTMPAAAMAVLDAWLAERCGGTSPEDPVFTNHAGGRLSRKQVARIVKGAADRLHLEGVHPHILRHTMASLLYERGVDLRKIQERMGHVYLSTTEQYVHAVPVGKSEAAEKLSDL